MDIIRSVYISMQHFFNADINQLQLIVSVVSFLSWSVACRLHQVSQSWMQWGFFLFLHLHLELYGLWADANANVYLNQRIEASKTVCLIPFFWTNHTVVLHLWNVLMLTNSGGSIQVLYSSKSDSTAISKYSITSQSPALKMSHK